MVKRLEDKIMQEVKNVDESCTELWDHQKQFKDVL